MSVMASEKKDAKELSMLHAQIEQDVSKHSKKEPSNIPMS